MSTCRSTSEVPATSNKNGLNFHYLSNQQEQQYPIPVSILVDKPYQVAFLQQLSLGRVPFLRKSRYNGFGLLGIPFLELSLLSNKVLR